MRHPALILLFMAALSVPCAVPASADEFGDDLQAITSVGPRGEGHDAATAAVRRIERANAASLTRILAAMDGANPLAVNWLRGAFESVADRVLSETGSLPVDQLEIFLADTAREPRRGVWPTVDHQGRTRRR